MTYSGPSSTAQTKSLKTVDVDLFTSHVAEAAQLPARLLAGEHLNIVEVDMKALETHGKRMNRGLDYLVWRSNPLARYGTRWFGHKIKKRFIPQYKRGFYNAR